MKRTGGTALKDRFGSAVLELSPIPQHDKGLVLDAPVVHTQQNIRRQLRFHRLPGCPVRLFLLPEKSTLFTVFERLFKPFVG